MKRRGIIYMALALGIMLGYLPLSSLFFRPEAVEAQCIHYELNSCQENPADDSCPCSDPVLCTRINQTQSGNLTGAYGVDTWNTVLCACP